MRKKARGRRGALKRRTAAVPVKDAAKAPATVPAPVLPDWREVVTTLKKDLKRSGQLSDKDFSIRINAR
jgi:hypothetical protein